MKSRLVLSLSAVLLLVIMTSACGGKTISVSSIRQDYACSYELTVQEDTSTKDVAIATRPDDLEHSMSQGVLDEANAWQQAVEERNARLGKIEKGTALQIPARCNQASGGSVPAPQR